MTPVDHASPDGVADAIARVIGQMLRRVRTEAAPDDPNLSQASTLSHLAERGSASAADLARLAAVTPQSMGTILAKLEAAAMVERQPHPRDGRKVLFALTGAGIEARHSRRLARRTWLSTAIEGLEEAERDALIAAIPILDRLGKSKS